MIYTVTLNPSLDFISQITDLKVGRTNYSSADSMSAGGRAINISRLLRTMHVPTTATGFLGGKTGEFIREELNKQDIPNDFIEIAGTTRINISLFSDQLETRVVGEGPTISINEVNELMYYLARIREGDFLILAGSLPPNVPVDIYNRMIEIAVVNGASFLPMVSQTLMKPTMEKHPLLITPTLGDLEKIFDCELRDREEILEKGLACIDRGAQNVLVNLGREGSLFIDSSRSAYEANGPEGPIISQTYTNIALAAGFIGSYMRTDDPVEAFRSAQAVSNATYSVRELPSLAAIEQAREKVTVLPLN